MRSAPGVHSGVLVGPPDEYSCGVAAIGRVAAPVWIWRAGALLGVGEDAQLQGAPGRQRWRSLRIAARRGLHADPVRTPDIEIGAYDHSGSDAGRYPAGASAAILNRLYP